MRKCGLENLVFGFMMLPIEFGGSLMLNVVTS